MFGYLRQSAARPGDAVVRNPKEILNFCRPLADASNEKIMTPVDPIVLLRSLDTVSDFALIYDRLLRVVYVNRAARELGNAASELGRYAEEAFRAKEKLTVKQCLLRGEDLLSLETIFTPVLGDHGNPQFVIAISRELVPESAPDLESDHSIASEMILPSDPEGGSTPERNDSVGARSMTETAEE
jgi:hypothetical protein